MIDVTAQQLKTILGIINRFIPGCEVRVFGSRFKHTAKRHSDLDLILVADKRIDFKLLWKAKESLEESDIPFRVDIIDWNAISAEFKRSIGSEYEVIQKAN
jgi:predicted nucleotidyltransferase